MSILIKNQDMPPEGEKYLLEIQHDGTVYDATGQRVAARAVQFEYPWHKVEEPPKDSKPVLCWEKQGFPYVDRYFQKYGWEFAANALAEPICWMPIEPPKEV